MAVQDQLLLTRLIKHYIDRTTDFRKCRMCRKMDENVSHLVPGCNELAQNEYKKLRHDKVTALLHWQWCKTYGFETHEKYYEHFVEKEMRLLENERVKILWDFSIQRATKIGRNKQDVILLEKKEKICYIVDVACPFDQRIEKKEKNKVKNYTDLKYEMLNVWKNEVTKVNIVPVVIGALRMVSKNISRYLEIIGFDGLEKLLKACLLGTARILRKVLDYSD